MKVFVGKGGLVEYRDGDKAFNTYTGRTYFIHEVDGELVAVCPEEEGLGEDRQIAKYFFDYLYMSCIKI